MQRRSIALLVLLAALLPVSAGAATVQARLFLLDSDPVAFRGTGFKAHERVRLVVYAGTRTVKWTTAGVRGGFVISFPRMSPSACAGFGATAFGNKGSRASFKRAPGQCPVP